VAWLIDSALLSVVAVPLLLVTNSVEVGSGFVSYRPGLGPILATLVATVYYGLFHGSAKGQTPGKMAMKIRVADMTTGGGIGLGRAVGRTVLSSLLWATAIGGLLDHCWPLWDDDSQALHDKAIRSVVNNV
jgi:uncharacterized RDD family membrane protein YckC